jgi:hypothetical protein
MVNENLSQANLRIALPLLAPRGHEELTDVNSLSNRIMSQNWGGTIGRALPDPAPPAPEGLEKRWSPPPAPWVKRSFTLRVPALPWLLTTFFEDLPGLVVTNISATGMNGPWTVDGVIYENLH